MSSISDGNRTYYLQTFGCQMNEHDSEMIAGMLEDRGFAPCDNREDAGIIIMNTCSVRENADNRFFGQLGVVKNIREKSGAAVAVCGCMMQQEQIVARIQEKYPWVDIVFGTLNIESFPQLLDEYLQTHRSVIAVRDSQDHVPEGTGARRKFTHKSFVNIMNGCNNFCSYCIVPYTRGREISRSPESIVAEIAALAADGVREVTLLGQNVNSYNGGSGSECDFAQLVHRIAEISGIERIRFMTSHPKDLSQDLIRAFNECDKLCRHVHLPVQSGSTEVLRRMNRKYTKESYIELTQRLRAAVPDIALTTDIIVGFPGETEADFQETLDLVRTVRFDSAFTFLYSVRTGTPAAGYPDQIPDAVKHERFGRLVAAVNEITAEKNAAYQGRIEKVLIDGPSARGGEGMCSGRTGTFKLVNLAAPAELIGSIADVRITEANTFSLTGELV